MKLSNTTTQLVFSSLQLLVSDTRTHNLFWVGNPNGMRSIGAILRDPNFPTFISKLRLSDLFGFGMRIAKAEKLKTKD